MKHSIPKKIVLIGSSTGGPGQISKIIASLPSLHNTSVVIAQHMVDGFLESFAQNLQHSALNDVLIVNKKVCLRSGEIYVCEGETKVEKEDNTFVFLHSDSVKHGYNPNINTLFNSFVPLAHSIEILAVILTGIGDDGVQACIDLSKNSVRCITETQESAIVDGMPGRARVLVPDIEVYDMKTIVNTISEFCE